MHEQGYQHPIKSRRVEGAYPKLTEDMELGKTYLHVKETLLLESYTFAYICSFRRPDLEYLEAF